ncbi:MAG: M64 family metallopeptidase [Paraprevotella sp.]|nr:M64 family metallopeptidase [Paraprevotella sp.]
MTTVTIVQKGTEPVNTPTEDKSVYTLQTASKGRGIPIVLTGDGFTQTEIESGLYAAVMNKTYENLFTEEPFLSLRDYFNVYAVTAVSKDNRFGNGYHTAFSCQFDGGNSSGVSGDDNTVVDYISCVNGIDIENTFAVVILNFTVYAGTTFFGYTNTQTKKNTEFAISYCPTIKDLYSEIFRTVLIHEAGGHGFSKLEDEYAYEENGTIPASEITQLKKLQALGWAQNVDVTDDPKSVLWSQFLSDNRYASEDLGVYEGAMTYIKGAYRPSTESMMNNNLLGFNAPSRQSIYRRVMKYGEDKEPTYEDFVTFDLQTLPPARIRKRSTLPSTTRPFAPPVFTRKALF